MRPLTSHPAVIAEFGGRVTDPARHGRVEEVRICQRLSLPVRCEISFQDPPHRQELIGLAEVGSALRIRLDGTANPLFEGEVTAVEQVFGGALGNRVRVRGYDVLHRLRRRQTLRAMTRLDAVGLARELAGDLAITIRATDGGPVWDRIMQSGQTDLELLREVCDRAGLYFFLQPPVLDIFSLAGRGPHTTLRLGDTLLEARFETNGEPGCRSVTALGWDLSRVEARRGETESARSSRPISGSSPWGRQIDASPRLILNEVWEEDQQADAAAQGELDRRVSCETVLWGVASGDPELQPGVVVEIQGLGPDQDGRYTLTETTHTVRGELGFLSELTTAVPVRDSRPWGATMTVAVVSSVADPDGLGRVQVVLPAFGGIESGWITVVGPAGGAGKGLVMLPDVGDQVLVLFARGDLTQGVVLGGLVGTKPPPDWGVEDGAVRRYTLQTSAGQRIVLDDSGSLIRLENTGGSFVELTPERVLLHAMAGLEIRAPGNPVVIRGASIDFRRA